MATRKRNPQPPASRDVVRQARRGKSSSSRGRARWEGFKSIAGAIAIFLVFRTFLVEAFRIPSGSMIPALLVGDWLFVNKLVYGPHIPFTSVNLPGYSDPKRSDVVVFESPPQSDQPWDQTPTLVKRLIGMPGDTIMMRDGIVYVNGIAQRQGYGAADNPVGDPDETSPLFAWQHSYELRGTRFGAPPAQPTHDHWGPLLIPQRRYMMLGDNRYFSKDSRYWGLVPRENVRGRPIFVYYSYDPERGAPFVRALTAIRWGRIGHLIR